MIGAAVAVSPSDSVPPSPPAPPARLLSLDAFRGLAVAAMIFVNNADRALPLLGHSKWNGLTFSDMVFPSFIFIVGVSMALAYSKPDAWSPRRVRAFLVRIAVLFGLGLLINALYSFAARSWEIGFNGVLQRIALSSLIAAPFSRRRTPTVVAVALGLLALHAALLLFVPFPGGRPGDFSRPAATLPAYVERVVFGKPESAEPIEGGRVDPENLVGVISSAGGMLLGVAAGGVLLRRHEKATMPLVSGGIVALVAGLALSPWLPVNKHLWTSTFVLVTAGVDALVLAALHWWVDLGGHRRMALWLEPLGRNALALYVGSVVVSGVLLAIHLPGGSAYVQLADAFKSALGPSVGMLLFAAANVAVWYSLALWLDRRGTYLRL